MPDNKTIGMMEGAYFVGRKELLSWVNQFFELNLKKIEETCTGAVHCQIMDCLYPGQVPLHKVNFNAKFDYEYIKNYKILQAVFNRLGIQKVIEVNKLIKGKYQDNLEFLQWMKRYHDMHYNGQDYDAAGRRKQAMNSQWNKTRSKIQNPNPPVPRSIRKKHSQGSAGEPRMSTLSSSTTNTHSTTDGHSKQQNNENMIPSQEYNRLRSNFKKLHNQANQMKLTIDSLAKERDFYFDKLRKIEILVQEGNEEGQERNDQGQTLIPMEVIREVLYATSDEPTESEEQNDADLMEVQHNESNDDAMRE